jgi:hypothetical protein
VGVASEEATDHGRWVDTDKAGSSDLSAISVWQYQLCFDDAQCEGPSDETKGAAWRINTLSCHRGAMIAIIQHQTLCADILTAQHPSKLNHAHLVNTLPVPALSCSSHAMSSFVDTKQTHQSILNHTSQRTLTVWSSD